MEIGRNPERSRVFCARKMGLGRESRVGKRQEWFWLQVREHTQKKKREQALNEWAETHVFTRDNFSESLQWSWHGLSFTQLDPGSVQNDNIQV